MGLGEVGRTCTWGKRVYVYVYARECAHCFNLSSHNKGGRRVIDDFKGYRNAIVEAYPNLNIDINKFRMFKPPYAHAYPLIHIPKRTT